MKRLLERLQGAVASRSGAFSALPSRDMVRWTSRRWLRRMGWPGVLAIGILAMCPAFYFSAIRTEQARLDMARDSVATLHEQLAPTGKLRNGARLGTEDQLAEFYRRFPVEEQSPLWLEKLLALSASHGLSLNDAEYKSSRDKVGKLVRYQITFPLKGEYPQIRKFLTDLSGALPVVALENVQFERQKVSDPNVEARIKLVLYLGQAS